MKPKPKYQPRQGHKPLVNGSALKSAELERWTATRVSELKERLLEQFHNEFPAARPDSFIGHAVREAEALAWLTPFPHLFLPGLAEEKVQNVRIWRDRQEEFLARGDQFEDQANVAVM